jgi:hypothetical protein
MFGAPGGAGGAGGGGAGGNDQAPFSPGERRRRLGDDDSMDGGRTIGWWVRNQDLVKLDGLSLLAKTKEMLGQTFMIIDDDGNGVIDSEDFSNLPAAMDKWDDLKLELFSNEDTVDPRKFVIGITNKAWKNPADQAKQLFQAAETGKSYRNLTSILNKALNDSIEKTLRDLLCDLLLYTPEVR